MGLDEDDVMSLGLQGLNVWLSDCGFTVWQVLRHAITATTITPAATTTTATVTTTTTTATVTTTTTTATTIQDRQ